MNNPNEISLFPNATTWLYNNYFIANLITAENQPNKINEKTRICAYAQGNFLQAPLLEKWSQER